MNRTIVGAFWLVADLAVILLPLAIMMVPPTPSARPFWVEFSLGLGFVGVLQIAVQFVLVARYRTSPPPTASTSSSSTTGRSPPSRSCCSSRTRSSWWSTTRTCCGC